MVRQCLLITLIKCLKGHKSLGSLCSVVKTLIVSGNRQTDQGTRCPIELFWTAKKINLQFGFCRHSREGIRKSLENIFFQDDIQVLMFLFVQYTITLVTVNKIAKLILRFL